MAQRPNGKLKYVSSLNALTPLRLLLPEIRLNLVQN